MLCIQVLIVKFGAAIADTVLQNHYLREASTSISWYVNRKPFLKLLIAEFGGASPPLFQINFIAFAFFLLWFSALIKHRALRGLLLDSIR